ALAPETSASTIPPPGLLRLQSYELYFFCATVRGVFFTDEVYFFTASNFLKHIGGSHSPIRRSFDDI
ncbi:MAG: hypothetical protein OSJ46_11465, partial [Duncaniella sp.]|nr:hypothetical protein [Duncaniella sp.]